MKKLIIVCVSIFLFSCSHENSKIDENPENSLKSYEDFIEFINTDSKNSILIQSVTTLNSPNNMYTITAKRKEINSALSFKIDGVEYKPNEVTINNNTTFWSRTDKDLTNIFGKSVNLSFNNNQVLARTNETEQSVTNISIPQLINVSVSNLEDGKVVAGTTITWNIDPANTNGMLLAIEYDPLAQSNEYIAETYDSSITKGSTIIDSGSYTITSNDLSYYPDLSNLAFYIVRANFIITNDGDPNNDLSVGAYTAVRSDFVIEK